MSTPAYICYRQGRNIRGARVQFDGYREHLGEICKKMTDFEQIKQLVERGYVVGYRSIDDVDSYELYDYEGVDFGLSATSTAMLLDMFDATDACYLYLFTSGKWKIYQACR